MNYRRSANDQRTQRRNSPGTEKAPNHTGFGAGSSGEWCLCSELHEWCLGTARFSPLPDDPIPLRT